MEGANKNTIDQEMAAESSTTTDDVNKIGARKIVKAKRR